ncbi:hypothetical protein SNE40_006989 [Patella caerulea]|uniref:Uncharacterized protein n=1 Tax=Patella caerulea TaxID=87958 RepID=A0AAN8JWU0_PATCE
MVYLQKCCLLLNLVYLSLITGDQFTCHCNDGDCNQLTGACSNGCLPGWSGQSCQTECPDGSYGYNCSGICDNRHCLAPSSCDKITGACDNGCLPGWRLHNCSQECVIGFYGERCSLRCDDRNCRNYCKCDAVYGSCNGSCLPGYVGLDCRHREYYGENDDGGEGTTTPRPSWWMTSTDAAKIGIFGGVMLIVIICGIALEIHAKGIWCIQPPENKA